MNSVDNRARGAFSLMEVIVVVSIVAVLAALSGPAFVQARKKASEPVCISNLRQMWVALQLYRDSYDGAHTGSSTEMAFPPMPSSFLSESERQGVLKSCRGISPFKVRGYYFIWPPVLGNLADEGVNAGWKAYVEAVGDPVVICDLNHQPAYPVSRYSTVRALAITLNGASKTHRNMGLPYTYDWWHSDQTGGIR